MFVSFLFAVVFFQAATFPVVALEAPPGEGVGCIYSSGEYGLDSGYIKNLRSLITDMATHTKGFFESSAGHSQDKVYLTSFCFGDLSIIDCRLCQAGHPFSYAYTQCPKLKEATFWSDSCLMRYSPYPTHGRVRNISSRINVGPKAINSSDLVHVKRYTEIIQQLLKNTVISSVGDSRHKFATAEAAYNTSTTIYSAMQCSPDLSRSDCLMCLQHALHILEIENGFGQLNARVYLQSCTLRYDQVKFYGTSTGKGRSDEESKLIVVLVAGFVSLTLLIVASIIIFIKLKKTPHSNIPHNIESTLGNIESTRGNVQFPWTDDTVINSMQLQLNILTEATENFSEANKLGEGGFSSVYKGRLSDGQEIAVKKLKATSARGEENFTAEVQSLAKLQHRNLVKLIGFCCQEEHRVLVYELLPCGSLDKFLFGGDFSLEWRTRSDIIIGIARGIAYLHRDTRRPIIHRDLKAGNILLDNDMCPKIADFGLARFFDSDKTHVKTVHIAGTLGYWAPEYALEGKISTEMDVFSFGVLVLEIISGKKCTEEIRGEQRLATFAWEKWHERSVLDIVDSTILDRSESHMERFITVALLCIQNLKEDRPNMNRVVTMLTQASDSLPMAPQHTRVSNSPVGDISIPELNRIGDECISQASTSQV